MEFVHLHGHTTYSLGDATTLIKSDPENDVVGLPETISKLGMKACAITDHGTMAGVVEFWKECKKWGVKPLFGMEAYIAFRTADAVNDPKSFENPTGHIILLARTLKGYHNLCLLLRKASLEKHFSHHPRVDLDMIHEHREGLIGLTSCIGGLPQKAMLGWRHYDKSTKSYLVQPPQDDLIVPLVGKMKDIFEPGCFFLEVQNHQMPDAKFLELTKEQQDDYQWMKEAQWKVVLGSWQAGKATGVPLVVTNDFHYLSADMADTRQAVLAIGGRGFMNEKFSGNMADQNALDESEESGGVHEATGQLYVKSPDLMAQAAHFKDYPFLMQNTVAIAEMIDKIDLSPGKDEKGRTLWNLPPVPLEVGETPISKLTRKAMAGFDSRYPGDTRHPWRTKECRNAALKQLEYELTIMEKLGLESYHLMVADYVEFAHKNAIRVGPGRGSGAGSVVVYCLGITDLDPLRHGLLFERYLNPDRASAADLDIDFDPQHVDKIYQYCIETYGKENIARISSYGSLHAKGSLRRLGRAMCLDPEWVNEISGKLDDDAGESRTRLCEVIEDNRSKASSIIRKFKEAGGPMAQRFLDIAIKLDDIKISRGQHAAGIVVSGSPLDGVVPLVFHDRKDPTSIATEIPFDHLEDIGLLKQDLLVVDGLSIIDLAIKFIRQRHDPEFELLKEVDETYDDEVALKIFSDGELAGIWQMSSSGMRELCVSLMPKDLNEIAAICALYRPGPLNYQDPETMMNMVEMYVRRKHKLLPVTYDHPKLKSILEETFGVIVFQEQIMHLARAMCDWTFVKADYLRKAVAKKKGISEQKDKFIPDCLKATPDFGEHMTHRLWDMIETFGKYGFNKSVTGDTIVASDRGYVRIDDVTHTDRILTLDPKSGNIVPSNVITLHDHGLIPVYEVEFDDGSKVVCTLDHKFLTDEGQVPVHEITRKNLCVWGIIPEQDLVEEAFVGMQSSHRSVQEQQKERCSAKSAESRFRTEKIKGRESGTVQKTEDCLLSGSSLESKGSRSTFRSYEAVEFLVGRKESSVGDGKAYILPKRDPAGTCGQVSFVAERKPGRVCEDSSCSNILEQEQLKDGRGAIKEDPYLEETAPCPSWQSSKEDRLLESTNESHCGSRWSVSLSSTEWPGKSSEDSTERQETRGRDFEKRMEVDTFEHGVVYSKRSTSDGYRCDCRSSTNDACGISVVCRRVVRISYVGRKQTYDLEVDHPEHNFILANGICTSNSHSAAYGKLSYQMAYIKGRYPVEFLAAAITIACDKGDKAKRVGLLHDFVSEAARRGISILPPDIELSKADAVPEGPSAIRLGFGACRGVSSAALKLETIKEVIWNEPAERLAHEHDLHELEEAYKTASVAVEDATKNKLPSLSELKQARKELAKQIKELGPVPEPRYGLNTLPEAVRTVFATGVNRSVVLSLVHSGVFDKYGDRNAILKFVEDMSELRAKKGKSRMEKFFSVNTEDVPADLPPATPQQVSQAAQEYLYLVLPTVEAPPPKKIWGYVLPARTKEMLEKLTLLPKGETELYLTLADSEIDALMCIGKFNSTDVLALVRQVNGKIISIT